MKEHFEYISQDIENLKSKKFLIPAVISHMTADKELKKTHSRDEIISFVHRQF